MSKTFRHSWIDKKSFSEFENLGPKHQESIIRKKPIISSGQKHEEVNDEFKKRFLASMGAFPEVEQDVIVVSENSNGGFMKILTKNTWSDK